MAADGVERRLGKGKPVALLTYLSALPGRRAGREHLAGLLWADGSPEAARQNLRQTLWYLRKKLGDGVVIGTDADVAIVARVDSDRERFLEQARRGDVGDAVQSYVGPFVPEFAAPGAEAFEEWADLERRRLVSTFLRCAESQVRTWLSAGRFADAQTLARRARDAAPLDQAAWRLLLESLVAGSDALGAAAEAEHLQALLAREEFDAEPATRALLRTARLTAPARPSGEQAEVDPRSLAPDLIGREAQFSRLLALWEQAREGRGGTAMVVAPAGLGKSRLLGDLRARLRASRTRVAMARAHPGDASLPGAFLASIVEAVAALPGAAAVSPGTAGVLVALVPSLQGTFAAARPDETQGEDVTRRRALALVELVRAVADEAPVCLLLDDLHWADSASAAALGAALPRLDGGRSLVVLAKRPSPVLGRAFAWAERMELPPLDLTQVSELLSRLGALPADDWAQEFPAQLLAASDGVPLLLLETLRQLLGDGVVSLRDHRWIADDDAELSTRLQAGSALRQRVAALPTDARALLESLAVLGRPADIGWLDLASRKALLLLEERGFVLRDGDRLLVAHDEIGAAAAEQADALSRTGAHRVAGEWLLSGEPDDTRLRLGASHARRAGDLRRSRAAWLRFWSRRNAQGDRRPVRVLATEFLGDQHDPGMVAELVAALPWQARGSRLALTVSVAALLVAAGAGLSQLLSSPQPTPTTDPVATLEFDLPDGPARLVLRGDERFDDDTPMALEPSTRSIPPALRDVRHLEIASQVDDGPVIGVAYFPDSGAQDLFRLAPGGVLERPWASPGDDNGQSLSPDGRQLLFASARWDRLTDHTTIALTDASGGVPRRLLSQRDVLSAAYWSPDGTRIAFVRQYFTAARPTELCLMHADGANERCPGVELGRDLMLLGWADPQSVILHSGRDGRIERIDLESRERRTLGAVPGQLLRVMGPYALCRCQDARGRARLELFRWDDPSHRRPLQLPAADSPAYPWVLTTWPPAVLVESLTVRAPDVVAAPVQLAVIAWGRDARPRPARALRFVSLDTGVAVVDSTGLLTPRRQGTVRVVASAGGWRADTVTLRTASPDARPVQLDRWDANWLDQWVPFGEPRPRLVAERGVTTLDLNGDGKYASGLYTRRAFDARAGLSVELWVAVPLTALQWQNLTVAIEPEMDMQATAAWDHRTGPNMFGSPARPRCAFGVPDGEGGDAVRTVQLQAAGRAVAVPAPAGLYDGRWVHIRLELFPDGRCALSLNARRVATTSVGVPPSATTRAVLIGANALGGRVRVGPLEIWEGVRGEAPIGAPPPPLPTVPDLAARLTPPRPSPSPTPR